jgi:hypothetical protein
MNDPSLYMKKTAFLLFLPLFSFFAAHAQGGKIIKFKHEFFTFKPSLFYISSVKDDRADTTTIGSVRSGIFSKKMVSLNLQGGAATALGEFIKTYLVQDRHQTPFELHITQLEAAEQTGGFKAGSEIHISVAFYGGGKKIADYKGSYSIDGNIDATRYIEELIRRGLDNIFRQFDDWYRANKEQVQAIMSGPSFKIEVEIKEESKDSDQLVFSLRRQLILDDFKGKPDDLSRGAAATYSGVDVKYNSQSLYGQVTVLVTITPFFEFSRSWCRTGSRTARTLQHEQQHFNITALVACEMANEIRIYPLSVDNYKEALEKINKEKNKEIQQRQDQYDMDTKHGLITAVQQKWEQQIRGELSKQTCYH